MNPWLLGIAFAVTVGAVIAVSAGERRAALVGLAIVVGAAPFLADPLPQLSTLATRVVGAALAAYLLRAATASTPTSPVRTDGSKTRGGSRIGWPSEGLLAMAAWVVGVSISAQLAVLLPTGSGLPPEDIVAMLTPSALGTGAGLATIVVAIVPAFTARDTLRSVIAGIIVVQGVLLLTGGVAGLPGDLEQLAGVALLVAVAIAGSVLVGREVRPSATGEDAPMPVRDADWRVTDPHPGSVP